MNRLAALLCAFLTLAWGSCALAAIGTPTVILPASSGTDTCGTSCSFTVNASTSVGDALVAVIKSRTIGSTVSGFSDSGGNTWVVCPASVDPGGFSVSAAYALNTTHALTSGVSTLTVTWSASNTNAFPINAAHVSGVTGIDHGCGTGANGTSASPSVALAAAGSTPAIAFGVLEGTTQDITAESSSFTSLSGVNAGNFYDFAYQKITSGSWGNSSNYSPTLAASSAWAASYVSFTGASVAAACTRALLGVGC